MLCLDGSDVRMCSRDGLGREYVLLDYSKAGRSSGPWMVSTRQQLVTTTIRYVGSNLASKVSILLILELYTYIDTKIWDGSLASPRQWLLVSNTTKR